MCDIGLSLDTFWRLTPAQFFACVERKEAQREEEYFRTGILASTVANVQRGKNRRPYKPSDFMPVSESKEKKRKARRQKMSPEEMKAVAMQINIALGGTTDDN